MGYTHYWRLKKDCKKLSNWCVNDIKRIVKKHKDIIQYEDDVKKKSVVKDTLIRFNGIGKEGHETFYFQVPLKPDEYQKFDEKGYLFNFCKTARKPYDIVVCEILLVLKAELGNKMILESDGFSNYTCSFDGVWSEAIEEVKQMGYKIDCSCYSRDGGESPYYDCEIKSVRRE